MGTLLDKIHMKPMDIIKAVRSSGADIRSENMKIIIDPSSLVDAEVHKQIQDNRIGVLATLNSKYLELVDLAKVRVWEQFGAQVNMSEVIRVMGDESGVEDCTPAELELWACGIALRMIQTRGEVPKDWDHEAKCIHCGYVWCPDDTDKLQCGWCWMREEGKTFPQPKTEV